MGYIKFVLSAHKTDASGCITRARISRIESDMDGLGTYETNLILHALSAPGGRVVSISDFILDSGILDNENDILG